MHEQQNQTFKKKKQEFSYEIRRTQREEKIRRRRNLQGEIEVEGTTQKKCIVDESIRIQLEQFMEQRYVVGDLAKLAEFLKSDDILKKHQGIIGIRKLLCNREDISEYIIQLQLIPLIVTFAQQNQYPQLKLEAAWSLANLLNQSGQICEQITKHNTIPLFIEIVENQNSSIAEQGLWAIGNLCAEGNQYRDQIIRLSGLKKIISRMSQITNKKQLKTFAWAISNVARGSPPPDYDQVKIAVPILGGLIRSQLLDNEEETLSDCLWSLSGLSDGQKIRLQRVVQTGALPKITSHTLSKYPKIYIPALRILGNCSASNEQHTNALLSTNFLDFSLKLLSHQKNLIRREVAWMISNIAAGTEHQALAVLMRKQLIQRLVNMLKSQIPEIKAEICWIFVNLGRTCDHVALVKMYEQLQLTYYICQFVNSNEPYILKTGLEMLYKYLVIGEKAALKKMKDQNSEDVVRDMGQHGSIPVNPLYQQVLKYGLGPRLLELQHHEEKTVYDGVVKIFERFSEEEA